MKNFSKKVVTLTTSLLVFYSLSALSAQESTKHITIGTSGTTSVYYQVGRNICRLVNKDTKTHGLICKVKSTGGSVYNLNTIRSGDLDMGLVQSDWQFHAYKGSDKFSAVGPNSQLRAIFSAHPRPLTVVVRADSGIKNFYSLRGKRVNLGGAGSEQRKAMEVVMGMYNWNKDSFKEVSVLKAHEQAQALCDNNVDAIVYTASHPDTNIKQVSTLCDVRLIKVDGRPVKRLVNDNPYYSWADIPGGIYKGNDQPIQSFGVGATFVASASVDDDLVYTVVKAVFDNFDEFRRFHPSLAGLDRKAMVSAGLSAPLHSGAMKYYKEAKLIK